MTSEAFRDTMRLAVQEALPEEFSADIWENLAASFFYHSIAYDDADAYRQVKACAEDLSIRFGRLRQSDLLSGGPADGIP
jgi:glucose-6-phosphate 1-dehydrogenase